MGIVGVSQKRGYKTAKWVLLSVGCVFFLMGGIFMLSGIGASNLNPQKIHLTAAGLTFLEEDGVYSLNVYKKQTSIMVNTGPRGSSSRVTFTIEDGSDCIEKIPSIWPGNYTVLTLKGDSNTPYQFGRTVEITVSSAQRNETLLVNIILPPDEVSFAFQIKHSETGSDIPNNTISAESYLWWVYSNYPETEKPSRLWSEYKLDTKFMVWGTEIEKATGSETLRRVVVDAVPQGKDDGIRLFGVNAGSDSGLPDGFDNIYIPLEVLLAIRASSNQNVSRTARFKITAEYRFSETSSPAQFVDFFDLKIVK